MARPSDEEVDERLAGAEGWERRIATNDFELAAKIDSSA